METLASRHSQLGITVDAYKPLPSMVHVAALTSRLSSYQHERQVLGDFWSAKLGFIGSESDIEEWWNEGLARRILTRDEGLGVCWEGFVNEVQITRGGKQQKRGPVLGASGVSNQCIGTYTTRRYNTNPPIGGVQTWTGWYENTVSQARYGIIQDVPNLGECDETEANQAMMDWIEEHANPDVNETLTLDQAREPSIELSCLGYVHMLDHFIYNAPDLTGWANASDKITTVLGTDPNSLGLLSGPTGSIAANLLQVVAVENQNRTAWAIIKAIVGLGDTSYNRWLFGLGPGRNAFYKQAPTTADYRHRLADRSQQIYNLGGSAVPPWRVAPGHWSIAMDFNAGQSLAANLREEPRAQFIESVAYSAPLGLTLNGGRQYKLTQRLAQYGLGGS